MILAAALCAGAARADVVVLEDGSEREGRVVRQDEKEVVLEVAAGKIKMELVLQRSEVRSIRKGRTANEKLLAEMKKRRSRLNDRNVAGWLAYARWLDRQPGLGKEARVAFEKVIVISPNNEAARRRLGYYRVGRKWVTGEGAGPAAAAGRAKKPDPELEALRRGLAEVLAADRGVSNLQGGCYGYDYCYYPGYCYPYLGYYESRRLGQPFLTITGRNQLGRTAEIRFGKKGGNVTWVFVR